MVRHSPAIDVRVMRRTLGDGIAPSIVPGSGCDAIEPVASEMGKVSLKGRLLRERLSVSICLGGASLSEIRHGVTDIQR